MFMVVVLMLSLNQLQVVELFGSKHPGVTPNKIVLKYSSEGVQLKKKIELVCTFKY